MNSIEAYRKTKDPLYLPYIQFVRATTKFYQTTIHTSYGEIAVTIYRPDENLTKKRAVYFNFHGGGFVLGYYEQDGRICQEISQGADCIVVNIDYLLAPEHKFPAPVLSAAEVILHVIETLEGLDEEKIFIGGFSAGGNLSISTYLCLKEQLSGRVKGLLSAYAPVDFSINEETRVSEKPELAISPIRLKEYKEWYFSNNEEHKHPLASPIYGDLTEFPPTFILSAEYDSLCHEEKRLAKTLQKAGNEVVYHCYPVCTHGFTHELFSYHEKNAKEALAQIVAFVRDHS